VRRRLGVARARGTPLCKAMIEAGIVVRRLGATETEGRGSRGAACAGASRVDRSIVREQFQELKQAAGRRFEGGGRCSNGTRF